MKIKLKVNKLFLIYFKDKIIFIYFALFDTSVICPNEFTKNVFGNHLKS